MADDPDRARHWGGMTVIVYDREDATSGVVLWDGEAAALGLPHATRWPPPRKDRAEP